MLSFPRPFFKTFSQPLRSDNRPPWWVGSSMTCVSFGLGPSSLVSTHAQSEGTKTRNVHHNSRVELVGSGCWERRYEVTEGGKPSRAGFFGSVWRGFRFFSILKGIDVEADFRSVLVGF